MKLYIKLGSFTQSSLYATNFSHLATNVEMNQFQAVFHILLFQEIKCLKQFAGSQSKLTGITTGFFPFTTTGRSKFNTNTDIGHYIQLLRHLGNKFQLIHFFYNEKNTLAHLLCKQSKFNITFVFISVADNQRIRICINSNYSMEFRFGASFKTKIKLLSMTDYLFHNRTHLIYLNRVNDEILCFIAILFSSLFKAMGCLLNPIIQNIRKTQQHGSCYITQLQFIDQLLQIDTYAILTRCNNHMTFVIYTKVRSTPTCYVVEFLRIFNTPLSHFNVFSCVYKIFKATKIVINP